VKQLSTARVKRGTLHNGYSKGGKVRRHPYCCEQGVEGGALIQLHKPPSTQTRGVVKSGPGRIYALQRRQQRGVLRVEDTSVTRVKIGEYFEGDRRKSHRAL